MKILIVDDDGLFRSLLREILELDGHDIIEAANGFEAIEAYRHSTCDLVITDILMPGIDGIQTIRRLQEINPGARIIAASGGGWQAPEEYLEMARDSGAARFLVKPFANEELLEAVHSLC